MFCHWAIPFTLFRKYTWDVWERVGNSGHMYQLQCLPFIGETDRNWKIAHVPLKGQEKFRYLFQGQKGVSNQSSGGILIDDLTLSETRCPNAVWHINNISHVLDTSAPDFNMLSPRFYSSEGYGYGLSLVPKFPGFSDSEFYISLSFHLISGENDGVLEWPALNRQATITVLDQHGDIRKRLSIERSFTTDETHVLKGRWSRNGYKRLIECEHEVRMYFSRSAGMTVHNSRSIPQD